MRCCPVTCGQVMLILPPAPSSPAVCCVCIYISFPTGRIISILRRRAGIHRSGKARKGGNSIDRILQLAASSSQSTTCCQPGSKSGLAYAPANARPDAPLLTCARCPGSRNGARPLLGRPICTRRPIVKQAAVPFDAAASSPLKEQLPCIKFNNRPDTHQLCTGVHSTLHTQWGWLV